MILSCADYSKFAKHYGTASWSEGPKKKNREFKDTKLKRFLRTPEKFAFIKQHFGEKGFKIYVFCVYDFLEYGVWNYVRRFVWKITKRMRNK